MNILVCVKQVPNTANMTIDPDTHRLVRQGVAAILNPADRYALERAFRFRDQHGGSVTVVSMGAPMAEDVLISAYLTGADRCILLTDAAFGGSDTIATASVLAAAIRYEEARTGTPFDMIFCGQSTIDGETGQVGPELAELLGIAHFTNISGMDYTGISCGIEYNADNMKLRVDAAFPVLVTYPHGGDACLRSAIPERLAKINEIKIPHLTFEDLSPWLKEGEIGLKGSATRVVRSYVPSAQRKGVRITWGTAAQKAQELVKLLVRDGVLGRKSGAAGESVSARPAEESCGRICVFVEQDAKGGCKNISLELLTPAIQIGKAANLRVSAILMGADNEKALQKLKRYPIDEIISCESDVFADYQVHDCAEAMSKIVEEYHPDGILVGGTAFGKEIAARVAGRFRTGLTAECTGICYDEERGCIVWSRPAYGGKLMADIICETRRPQMGTVREGVFVKPAECAASPEVLRVDAPKSPVSDRVNVLTKTDLPGFTPKEDSELSVIVSMGRGIRDMDGFDLICDFADAIGAEIGASRGCVDMKMVSPQYLIGSNGKTVRPGVYIACGISGSMQHMIGVMDAGCIVAINKDPNAEIFRYADYCVVGDLFQIVPALQDEMENQGLV